MQQPTQYTSLPKIPRNRSICMATPAHLKVPPAPTAVKSAALAAGSAANPQFLSKAAKRKGLAQCPGRIRCEPNLVIVATFASPSPSSLREAIARPWPSSLASGDRVGFCPLDHVGAAPGHCPSIHHHRTAPTITWMSFESRIVDVQPGATIRLS